MLFPLPFDNYSLGITWQVQIQTKARWQHSHNSLTRTQETHGHQRSSKIKFQFFHSQIVTIIKYMSSRIQNAIILFVILEAPICLERFIIHLVEIPRKATKELFINNELTFENETFCGANKCFWDITDVYCSGPYIELCVTCHSWLTVRRPTVQTFSIYTYHY